MLAVVRRALVVLVLVLTACRGEPPPLRADVPVESGDRSLILGFSRGGALQLQAFDVVDGNISPPWMLDLGEEDVGEVYALAYSQPLTALDIPAGPIPTLAAGAAVRPLPAPDRVQKRRLEGGMLAEWSVEPGLDAALAAVRFPIGCTRFETHTYPLPGGVDARFMVVASGRVLIGNSVGELYVAQKDGTFIKLAASGDYFDAYAQEDGTIFLGGRNGVVDRGIFAASDPPRLTLTHDSTVGISADISFIDGDPAAGATERAVITENGWRLDYRAGQWVPLYDAGSEKDLAWMGPGLIRGIFGYEYYLDGPFIDDGPERQDEVHVQTIDGGMSAIGYAPLVGPLSGTEYGAIYVRKEEDNWTQVVGLEAAMLQIRGLVGYRFGFMYARSEAIVEVEGQVPCPSMLAGDSGRDASQLGDEVVGNMPAAGRAELTIVGRDALVFGRKGPPDARLPYLFWFSAL